MARSPRFRHVDGENWQVVRQLKRGDEVLSVREKWLDFGPSFLSLYAEWDPGMMVQPHGHNSNHVVFVLEGEVMCGEVRCTPGMHIALDHGDNFEGIHIALDHGDNFGPFIAGPEGVVLFEVMMGDPRSFPARQDEWERLLAEKGMEKLPNPPIDLPDWLEDARN